jgi:hypothetical protein
LDYRRSAHVDQVSPTYPPSARLDVTLGGGVLNKGYSEKDLDLYFFPFGQKESISNSTLDRWLDLMWGTGTELGIYRNQKDEIFLTKKKFFLPDGKRIDVFIGAKKQSLFSKVVEKFWMWKYGERKLITQVVMDEESFLSR